MATVQPIRDKKKIKAMGIQLKACDDKYFMMFDLGVNVGLRISDILKLKMYEIYDTDHVTIVEQKTGKQKRFLINTKVQRDIKQYMQKNLLSLDDYVVPSRKHNSDGTSRPVSRIQAYRVLNNCSELIGLEEVGTHTMRKTFGYWHYQQYHDVALLQDLFNHAAPIITLRYIGITDDMKDASMQDFYLL